VTEIAVRVAVIVVVTLPSKRPVQVQERWITMSP
jgi:hypothetical protein